MWARIKSLWSGTTRRAQFENEMAEEMSGHLEARTEDLIKRGMKPEEARRQARIEFGAVEHYKEEGRASRGLRWIDELGGDLKYALRQLRRTPSFAVLAVSVLAIGIGANTAIFNVVDAVMLRMLPVQRPEQLRRLEWTARKTGFMRSYNGSSRPNAAGERINWSFSYPVYQSIRDRSTSFSGLTSFSDVEKINLGMSGGAELATGQIVSGNFYQVMGTTAQLGRTLLPEDEQAGAQNAVVVVSHGFWERRLGRDPSVLGQTISFNGTPVMIVGVLPKGMCGINPNRCPDVVAPITLQAVFDAAVDVLQQPDRWEFEVIGRLKAGVADERARAETEALMLQAIEGFGPAKEYTRPRVALQHAGQGLDSLRRQLQRPMEILAWAVGAILLIACANLAGLLLARATARRREIGTRLAIGAGRGRLIRQLLTESMLLSLAGGAAGIVMAYLAGDSLARLFLRGNDPIGVAVTLNFRVLAASIGLCLLTGIVFGLAPALRATGIDLLSMLRPAGRTGDGSHTRTGKALITVQVAMALILAAGSALFVRTLINLKSEPLGFNPENLLVFVLNPTQNGYREARLLDFYENVVKSIERLPGVSSVSMSRNGLLTGGATSDGVHIPGQKEVGARIHYIAPRFFETMEFPLLLGRDARWNDREASKKVVILNQTLARQLFGDRSALGQVIQLNDKLLEVIGVAGDTKYQNVRQSAPGTIYIPYRQQAQHRMTIVIRTKVAPKGLTEDVRRTVAAIDRNVPMFEIRTQVEQINEQMKNERVFAMLLSGFALMAIVLACMGIYGTLAYQVTRRTPEIGVRMALGARAGDVVRLVMRESIMPVIAGVAIGVWGALAAGKLVESMLYGLKPKDPVTLAVVAAALLGSALIAGWLPARRAARIAPMEALRWD